MSLNEIGTIYKYGYKLRVALVYPNSYYIGMSNLGFQSVYRYINQIDDIYCERFFYDKDIKRPVSIETGSFINDFDIICFSVSFELDYFNIFEFIKKINRNKQIIFAGGSAVFIKPEPLYELVDFLFIGEAECGLKEVLGVFLQNGETPLIPFGFAKTPLTPLVKGEPIRGKSIIDENKRKECLLKLKNISGVYVPSISKKIKFAKRISNLDEAETYTQILTPDTAFSNMKLIEIIRGCERYCKFCISSYIYGKTRYKSLNAVIKQIESEPKSDFIGLVGAAISDYPHLDELLDYLELKQINFSISSLRADSVTDKLIKGLKRSGQRMITIAPEAGSQKMRDYINKGITEEHVLNAVDLLVQNDISKVKLYFMIGFPEETQEDIEAVICLVKKIAKKGLFIRVNISPFVPKPMTPLSNAKIASKSEIKKKVNFLRKEISKIKKARLVFEGINFFYKQSKKIYAFF